MTQTLIFFAYYYRYSPRKCAKIGAYACVHGAAAATQHFSNKISSTVCESTVESIETQYKDELRNQQADTGR